MKYAVISSSKFGSKCLEAVQSCSKDLGLIIGLEPSDYDSDYIDFENFSTAHGIQFIRTRSINSDRVIGALSQIQPDVVFVLGWPFLLGPKVLSIAKLANIGYHPSLLPQNRGRHPIIWSICLGLKETGSTFFILDEGADTGPIVSQRKIAIEDNETATSLYSKLVCVGVEQFKTIWNDPPGCIEVAKSQIGNTGNTWRQRSKEDGVIDWRMSARSILRLIHALADPYPGASFYYDSKEYVVRQAQVVDCHSDQVHLEPGKVVAIDKDGGVFIKTGDGVIIIKATHQMLTFFTFIIH